MLFSADERYFEEIYAIMEESFPESERRDKESQRALFGDGRYKVLAGKDGDGKICAFLAYWELEGFTFMEHLAVKRALRGKGLGSEFLKSFLRTLEGAAVLEAELPTTDIAARRIAFYERHGFVLNGNFYLQPAMGEGKRGVEMKIMSRPHALSLNEFERAKARIYAAVYKINPSGGVSHN